MIYLTSDTHFCHDKPFIWEARGFTSVDEMNAAIVERWNAIVTPSDEVYHLGDVILTDTDKGLSFLTQLNGTIHLIRGNHDSNARLARFAKIPNIIYEGEATTFKYKKYLFYLSHYPTLTANYDANYPLKRVVLNLHGHTHQTHIFNEYSKNSYMYHVGMDSHDCRPVSIDQILLEFKEYYKK